MPIEVKGKIVVVNRQKPEPVKKKKKAKKKEVKPDVRLRTRFTKIRKRNFRTEEDYEKMKLVVDGEEKRISNSSKYFLDMLISDE